MNRPNRSHPAARLGGALVARAGVLGAVALALGAAAQAQASAPRFFVSTTSDLTSSGPLGAVSDGDVLLVQEAVAPQVARAREHWRATAGFDLGDVDGLARRPGSVPGTASSIAFSTQGNVGGFKDGDVLALAQGGGVELVVAEDVLVAAMGLTGGSIDVDAFAWDGAGLLHFSVQSDVSGTVLGEVKAGDVLRLNADGTVQRVLTEMDVEQKLLQATGSTAAVGDVHGLDIVGGEAIVTIQSPSAYDGTVLDCGQQPALLLTEDGAGLGGAELDALMAVGDDDVLPVIWFDEHQASEGATVHVEMRGEPGGGVLVLWAGDAGFVDHDAGFGGWYVDPNDPWLGSIFTAPTLPLAPLDGTGAYAIDYTLPVGVAGVGADGLAGWTFQVMDLASLAVSAPARIEAI